MEKNREAKRMEWCMVGLVSREGDRKQRVPVGMYDRRNDDVKAR